MEAGGRGRLLQLLSGHLKTGQLWSLQNRPVECVQDNFTADAHPSHVHLVQFELVNRQNLATDADGISTAPATLVGSPIGPENWEFGPKDTIAVYPGMVTRIKMTFDRRGIYLWHCHILDHEDNDTMRPYQVV